MQCFVITGEQKLSNLHTVVRHCGGEMNYPIVTFYAQAVSQIAFGIIDNWCCFHKCKLDCVPNRWNNLQTTISARLSSCKSNHWLIRIWNSFTHATVLSSGREKNRNESHFFSHRHLVLCRFESCVACRLVTWCEMSTNSNEKVDSKILKLNFSLLTRVFTITLVQWEGAEAELLASFQVTDEPRMEIILNNFGQKALLQISTWFWFEMLWVAMWTYIKFSGKLEMDQSFSSFLLLSGSLQASWNI